MVDERYDIMVEFFEFLVIKKPQNRICVIGDEYRSYL